MNVTTCLTGVPERIQTDKDMRKNILNKQAKILRGL